MGDNAERNTSSHPPLWRWDTSHLGAPPPPEGTVRAKRARPRLPAWRQWRKRMWVEVWYQGGQLQSVRIRSRGWEYDFPGAVAIMDVLQVLNGHRADHEMWQRDW